jgi:glycerol-3-phosphate dehydrogenase
VKREFERLGRSPFDLLVIGGGMYGAWVAYDAALRGLQVALVEKNDWASGTSSASSKLIHGGLRYLAQGRFGLVRKALKERRRLARLAPHRISPLRFALPRYRGARVGRTALGAGLWLYDRLAGRDPLVGPHRSLEREAMLQLYRFLRPDGLEGGFTYGDCQTDDARLVLELVDGAAAAGAVAVNHAPVTGLIDAGGRVEGAGVRDGETGRSVTVRAAMTVDCSGPWRATLSGGSHAFAARLTKGVHLVLPALPTDDAFLLPDGGGRRVIFMIPWYGRVLLGTTDTDFAGSPDRVAVQPEDVDYLLSEANRVLVRGWSAADVIASFAGLRVLPGRQDVPPSAVAREFTLHETRPGLLVPLGGKLSSARVDAATVVSRVMTRLGRRCACPTAERPFPWSLGNDDAGPELDRRSIALGLDAETAALCRRRYGIRVAGVHAILAKSPAFARRIVPGLPFCMAEVVHAVRDEMARSLSDLLRRRIPLSLLDRLDGEVVREVAEVAGCELDWTAARRGAEIEEFLADRMRPVAAAR